MAKFFIKSGIKAQEDKTAKVLLHEHLSSPQEGRGYSRVHASALTSSTEFCPRAYALSDLLPDIPVIEKLSTSERVTFQMGRDLEYNVVNWLARLGRAICHWDCLGCRTIYEYSAFPGVCVACGSQNFKVREVRFKSKVSDVSCGVDLLYVIGDSKLVPYEIKTIDKDMFKSLVAPLAEHRLRTNLYLRLISESVKAVPNYSIHLDHGYILYVSKGGYGCADPSLTIHGISEKFSPFKEFRVSRDDSETDILVSMGMVVKNFRNRSIGMPQGVCSTSLCKRALACPYKIPCFSGDFPPAIKSLSSVWGEAND